MAKPKKKGKFASIWLYATPPSDTCCPAFHKRGWKAVWIRSRYFGFRAPATDPSTESPGSMAWRFSAGRSSTRRPMLRNERPPHDISMSLPGGPTACEAALASLSAIRTLDAGPLVVAVTHMPASGSRLPNGEKPLKTLLARPSQKLRTFNAALMTLGELRAVVRRVLMPPTWNTPSGRSVQSSNRDWPARTKLASNTPCEPITSSFEYRIAESRLTGSASTCIGKSAAARV